MASNAVDCIGQRSACVIRATKLGPGCAPLTGTGADFVVASAIATITATPEVEEGTKFEPKDACGEIPFTAAEPDIIKRWTLELELYKFDYELKSILTDSVLILGGAGSPWAGKVIGAESPGAQSEAGNGVGLEIWVKTMSGTGVCGDVSLLPPYVRHVFPRALLRPNDRTFENDVATAKYSGNAEANVAWGTGPYGDYPGEDPLSGITAYAEFYDDQIPEATCGFADTP